MKGKFSYQPNIQPYKWINISLKLLRFLLHHLILRWKRYFAFRYLIFANNISFSKFIEYHMCWLLTKIFMQYSSLFLQCSLFLGLYIWHWHAIVYNVEVCMWHIRIPWLKFRKSIYYAAYSWIYCLCFAISGILNRQQYSLWILVQPLVCSEW